jgi:hypothetical protein
MEVDVDMFGLGMVIIVDSKLNCSLVVAEEGGWSGWKGKEFGNESVEPDGFFGHVRCSYILSFSGGQCNEFLFVWLPGNGAAINEVSVAWNGMMVLVWGSISISVAQELMLLFSISECKVMGASQIMKDMLGCFPVDGARIIEDVREGWDRVGDVRMSGNRSIHEAANGLLIWHLIHAYLFCRVGGAISSRMEDSWDHRSAVGFGITEPEAWDDGVYVSSLGEGDGVSRMIAADLDA